MPLPPGFVDELAAAVGAAYVLTAPEDLATYDCDGLTGWRAQPACVVLPGSAEDVQAVLRLCAREGIPFVARGAGTGLSGGALPVADGIVVPSRGCAGSSRSTSRASAWWSSRAWPTST